MDKIVLNSIGNQQKPLAEQVADMLLELIQKQHIREGEKLPNEFVLMDQLKVGRGTVREAVKLLAARNVLEIQRGRGTFVSKHTGIVEDPLGFAFVEDEVKLGADLLEIRLQIEPWMAELAAQTATEEDISAMQEACKAVDAVMMAKQNHYKEDVEFHIAIANCTRNLVIPKLIPIITYGVYKVGPLVLEHLERSNGERLTSETHHRIADAISAHDPVSARKAMEEHLRINLGPYIQKGYFQ